jgi:Flp pilus assembly protein TadG
MTASIRHRALRLLGAALRAAARSSDRFRRDERGANAVEFGIVALPFFALLMAIVEAAMAFFAAQVMETGLRDSARLIRTGQAHGQTGFNATSFRNDICPRVAPLLACAGIVVDVRDYSSFGAASFANPTSGGNFDPTQTRFSMGQAGSIIVARAYYEWPSFANILGSSLSRQANGRILLVATSSFRNEPFSN